MDVGHSEDAVDDADHTTEVLQAEMAIHTHRAASLESNEVVVSSYMPCLD